MPKQDKDGVQRAAAQGRQVGDIVRLRRNLDLTDGSQRLAGSVGRLMDVHGVEYGELTVAFPYVEHIDLASEEADALELVLRPKHDPELDAQERLTRLLYAGWREGAGCPLTFEDIGGEVATAMRRQAAFLLRHGVSLV